VETQHKTSRSGYYEKGDVRMKFEGKENRWVYSIFTRLIIIFLLIMLPIYGIGTVIFFISRNQLHEQFHNSSYMRMEGFLSQFEDEILYTQEALNFLTFDGDLVDLAGVRDFTMNFDHVRSINRLRNRLAYFTNTNRFIEVVSAYIPAIGMKVNSTRLPSYSHIDYNDMTVFNGHNQNPLLTRTDENLYLHSFSRLSYHRLPDIPLFALEAQLAKNNIYERMILDTYFPDSMFFLIIPESQFILSNANAEITENILALYINYPVVSGNDVLSSLSLANRYFLVSTHSNTLNAVYLQLTPEGAIFGDIEQLYFWYLILSACMVAVIIIFSSYTYKLIKKPINLLTDGFHALGNNDFDIEIVHEQMNEFGFLFKSFNETVANLKHLISEVYLQKLLVSQAELKQLQAQVNPHFLYNSFFTLQARIEKRDLEGAEQFCGMLGTYFQFITKKGSITTTLADEVEHARIYAEIQGIRFRNRVTVIFDDLPDCAGQITVPKLILQPVIENAFKYGLEDKDEDGVLWVWFQIIEENERLIEPENDCLHKAKLRSSKTGVVVHVEDNSSIVDSTKIAYLENIFTGDEIKEPSGLLNIHKRLGLFMDTGSGISFSKSQRGGLGVSIKLIPKELY